MYLGTKRRILDGFWAKSEFVRWVEEYLCLGDFYLWRGSKIEELKMDLKMEDSISRDQLCWSRSTIAPRLPMTFTVALQFCWSRHCSIFNFAGADTVALLWHWAPLAPTSYSAGRYWRQTPIALGRCTRLLIPIAFQIQHTWGVLILVSSKSSPREFLLMIDFFSYK